MSVALGSGGKPAAEMKVTPLIDVLLVLLIIFMIITPMDPHGLYTAVPQKNGTAAPPDAPIVLQLTQVKNAAPALSINKHPVVWAQLAARLLEIYKSVPMVCCSLKEVQMSISSTLRRRSIQLTTRR